MRGLIDESRKKPDDWMNEKIGGWTKRRKGERGSEVISA